MGAMRLPSTPSVDASKFHSTTARLLVAFAQGYFGVETLPADNKAVIKSAITSTTVTRLENNLKGTAHLDQTENSIKDIIDRVKALGTQTAKQHYELLNTQAAPVFEMTKNIAIKHEVLATSFNEVKKNVFNILAAILTILAAARNPSDKASSEEILSQFRTAEKNVQSIATAIDKLVKETITAKEQTKALIYMAIESLPATQRPDIKESDARAAPIQVR